MSSAGAAGGAIAAASFLTSKGCSPEYTVNQSIFTLLCIAFVMTLILGSIVLGVLISNKLQRDREAK